MNDRRVLLLTELGNDVAGEAAAIRRVAPHAERLVVAVRTPASPRSGSANLDITAGYWESELLVLVEDERVARQLEARLDELIAASHGVNPDDPEWQEIARRRQWMRHWPGVLSI